MKKILSIFMSLAVIGSLATTVVSCKSGPHEKLNKNLADWDLKSIFLDVNIYQAIALGKENVNIEGKSIFIDSKGKHSTILQVYANNWPGGTGNLHPKDAQLKYANLTNFGESMIYYYENNTKDNTKKDDIKLDNIENINRNLKVKYLDAYDYTKPGLENNQWGNVLHNGDSDLPSDGSSLEYGPMVLMHRANVPSSAYEYIEFFFNLSIELKLTNKTINVCDKDNKCSDIKTTEDGYYFYGNEWSEKGTTTLLVPVQLSVPLF